MPDFKIGDVVYAEGSSAILGDVMSVDHDSDDDAYDYIEVRWRETTTTEKAGDLLHAEATPNVEPLETVSLSYDDCLCIEAGHRPRSAVLEQLAAAKALLKVRGA